MLRFRADLRQQKQVVKTIRKAPNDLQIIVRQALDRGIKAFLRIFKKERLSGRPGLKAPRLKKTFKSFIKSEPGGPMEFSAQVFSGVPFLSTHEEGAIIKPKVGDFLFIQKRGARGKRRGVRKVRFVKIPPRLGFRKVFNRTIPAIQGRLGKAVIRALKLATSGKRISRASVR